ncbi:MAG: OsmC family protein [Caldilineales bacterium]|nr:OsmC family protein [Caldilineales bacterium]MCX7854247.1 OsmC family protein [Caldilineales bacterium]
MEARVIWDHGLSFSGTADSGFTLPLGAARAVGGEDDGFRPLELIAIGLAGCTAMDVISILLKKRQQVTGFEVRVQAERANDHPRVFTDIAIEYIVRGRGIDPAAVERAIELSETKYCSAHAMLAKAVPIHHTYRIIEEEPAPVA